MSCGIEIIDFSRPDASRKNLFITNLPGTLTDADLVVRTVVAWSGGKNRTARVAQSLEHPRSVPGVVGSSHTLGQHFFPLFTLMVSEWLTAHAGGHRV